MYGTSLHLKPGRPVAAVVTAAAMLAVCLALAGGLVSARGLADPVRPEGWGITFQPPKGWSEVPAEHVPATNAMRYCQPSKRSPPQEFTLAREPNPRNLPPSQVCLIEAATLLGIRSRGQLAAVAERLEDVPLGPLPGTRIILPQGPLTPGVYLHVGTWEPTPGDGEAYVMTLVPGDAALGQALAKAVRLGGR